MESNKTYTCENCKNPCSQTYLKEKKWVCTDCNTSDSEEGGTTLADKTFGRSAYRRWKRQNLITKEGEQEILTKGSDKFEVKIEGRFVKLTKVN